MIKLLWLRSLQEVELESRVPCLSLDRPRGAPAGVFPYCPMRRSWSDIVVLAG